MGIYLNTNDQALASSSVKYRVMSLMSIAYLLLFPVASTVLHLVSGLIVILTILSSMAWYWFPVKKSEAINRDERSFYFSVSFLVVSTLLATLFSGVDYDGMKKLGKLVYLLMVVPVYFYFKAIRVNPAWVWYGLSIGACVSALVGIYEISYEVFKPGYFGRAKGATHPIIFGDLSLLMGFMSLAGWSWFKQQASWQRVLPVIALLSGVLASVLSQSRGGWVAIPFLALIWLKLSPIRITPARLLMGLVSVMTVVTILYQIPQTGLKAKTSLTINHIQIYIEADATSVTGATSVTSRFEMLKASWGVFKEHPFFGVGLGNYQHYVKDQITQNKRNKLDNFDPAIFSHPHNQFASVMVSGGIFGLVAIFILFIIPIKIFYKANCSKERSNDARQMALAGIILMVGFAIFNLSESFLERSRTLTFFIFYLAVLMAGIREKNIEIISHKS